MKALRQTNRTARAIALLSLAAFALHQLRYGLAYGDQASQALAHQGHGYLSDLGGVLVALAIATLLGTLLAAALAPSERHDARTPTAWLRLTGAYSLGLLAIFCVQELVEGTLAAGHPSGVAAVLADGGWISVPLAGLLGAVCALVSIRLCGAEEALGRPAASRLALLRSPAVPAPCLTPPRSPLVALNLGFGFARRPPPLQPAL